MDNMQQLDEERYARALNALGECMGAEGVSWETLETLKFEMGIHYKDYAAMQERILRSKYKEMKGQIA